MATAYKVKSLVQLLKQVNAAAPKRSKASDGWLGDAAHAKRKSEHNPDADGSVDAIDITHDPKNGCDAAKLFVALHQSKDRRLKTVIHAGQIFTTYGPNAWRIRAYDPKKNPHKQHIHIDVNDKYQDDASSWNIASAFGKAAPAKPAAKPPVQAPEKTVEQASRDLGIDRDLVRTVQGKLKEIGYTEVGGVDGYVGDFTRAAILAFRSENGLPVSDKIDGQLITALASAKPRVVDPKRSEAKPAVVTERVPEAKAHWWNKWIGGGAAGLAGGGLGLDGLSNVSDVAAKVKEVADGVPGWVWLVLIILVAGGIYLLANRGEKKSVEAFQTGARR